MSERDLLTAEAAAERLGISERTLRQHVVAGTIPTVTIGLGAKRPRYRFDPADLETFVKSRKKYEGAPCQSTKKEKTKHSISTFGSMVIDLREIQAQRTAAKRSGLSK